MVEEYYDCEENILESEDDEKIDISDPFLSMNPLYTNETDNGKVEYYAISVRKVASFLETWCFNRTIDDNHLKKLKEELLRQNYKHFIGTVQVVRDNSKNYRVINGQHRLKVIHDIMKEDLDMKFDMNIMIELYNLDIEDLNDYNMTDENNLKIENIFKNANNSLVFKPDDDRELFCKKIICELKKDILFKNFFSKTSKTPLKPKISDRDLCEMFKLNLINNNKLDLKAVILRIKEINKDFSLMSIKNFFGREKPAVSRLKQYEKAIDLKIFLNVDTKLYPPDKWIRMI